MYIPTPLKTRCKRGVRVVFSGARMSSSITVLVCINPTLPQRKSCSVHMAVFEIIVHQLDIINGKMYLGADNSSIECRGTWWLYDSGTLCTNMVSGAHICFDY